MIVNVQTLKDIAEIEFSDIVISEDVVISSHISDNPELALKEFLGFVSKHVKKEPSES